MSDHKADGGPNCPECGTYHPDTFCPKFPPPSEEPKMPNQDYCKDCGGTGYHATFTPCQVCQPAPVSLKVTPERVEGPKTDGMFDEIYKKATDFKSRKQSLEDKIIMFLDNISVYPKCPKCGDGTSTSGADDWTCPECGRHWMKQKYGFKARELKPEIQKLITDAIIQRAQGHAAALESTKPQEPS